MRNHTGLCRRLLAGSPSLPRSRFIHPNKLLTRREEEKQCSEFTSCRFASAGDRICPSAGVVCEPFSLLSQLRGAAVLSGRLIVSCLCRTVTLIVRKLQDLKDSCRNHGNQSRVNDEMQLRRTNAGPEPVQTQCWASF